MLGEKIKNKYEMKNIFLLCMYSKPRLRHYLRDPLSGASYVGNWKKNEMMKYGVHLYIIEHNLTDNTFLNE